MPSTTTTGTPLLTAGISSSAVNSFLVQVCLRVQSPIYYVRKRLGSSETRYADPKKLALSLVVASRKLKHYFLAHGIDVLTNASLQKILYRPDFSGRLLRWSIELTQFDIEYKQRIAIKRQALADFIAEFTTSEPDADARRTPFDLPRWELFVDVSSNKNGSGAGMMLISLEHHKISSAIRFKFRASNNEAEYEALITGL